MFDNTLELFRCPRCFAPLDLISPKRQSGEILEGNLRCRECDVSYPIHNGIPRFVPEENYAENFGFEWHRFAELQTDRLHTHTLSHDRFGLEIGCDPKDLKGLRVLEAGCGGGRFTDIVLESEAELFAVDLSNAVDKNRQIHQGNTALTLIQGSIDAIPLAHEAFDLVFCLGVLQHTPDPSAFFRALVPYVKPGGRLVVDVYAAHPKQSLHWKYIIRPITKRMDQSRLLALIERAAPILVPISRQVRRVPKVGKALSRLIPIFVHDGFMGKVSPAEELRWAVLETFDALSPAYDRPRSLRAVHRWFRDAGMTQIETFNLNNALNYGRAVKPRLGTER